MIIITLSGKKENPKASSTFTLKAQERNAQSSTKCAYSEAVRYVTTKKKFFSESTRMTMPDQYWRRYRHVTSGSWRCRMTFWGFHITWSNPSLNSRWRYWLGTLPLFTSSVQREGRNQRERSAGEIAHLLCIFCAFFSQHSTF